MTWVDYELEQRRGKSAWTVTDPHVEESEGCCIRKENRDEGKIVTSGKRDGERKVEEGNDRNRGKNKGKGKEGDMRQGRRWTEENQGGRG